MQASIQQITELVPIENADKIEVAKVLGWSVVVKKGEFKAGDSCVFTEIDSVLPDGPEWSEFMRPRNFRVKTIRLRGQLSQGLVLPLTIFGYDKETKRLPKLTIGEDVTECLGIKHYEKPEAGGVIGGMSAGPFPPISKTDEIRLQSAPGLIEELKGHDFYSTVKIDGTSGTFARLKDAYGPYEPGQLIVCTRTRSIHRPEKTGNAFWAVADKYDLQNKLPLGFAIQGEVAGPKIQKNRLELKEHDLFVFNVFDFGTGKYMDYGNLVSFCSAYDLKMVPLALDCAFYWIQDADKWRWVSLSSGCQRELNPTLDDFLLLSQGYYDGTKNRREGIVIRPLTEMRSTTLGRDRFSFKVVNNEYLLKDEE